MGGKDKRRILKARAKKMARQAARKARQKRSRPAAWLHVPGLSKQVLQNAPVHDALLSDTFAEQGIGHAILSRTLPTGEVAAGVFLVDVYCMGLKDAFLTVRLPDEYAAMLEQFGDHERLKPVTPACLRKFVEGAIDYAGRLGLAPHRDYERAAVILGDIDPAECAETFTYGKDGKPFYVSGPRESELRIRQIVALLKSRCGENGFTFLAGIDRPEAFEDIIPEEAGPEDESGDARAT